MYSSHGLALISNIVFVTNTSMHVSIKARHLWVTLLLQASTCSRQARPGGGGGGGAGRRTGMCTACSLGALAPIEGLLHPQAPLQSLIMPLGAKTVVVQIVQLHLGHGVSQYWLLFPWL